jgi:glycosyltransferase involved in cell wall biosynthesis
LNPFFSIVTATYNRAYCIDKAIKSVLKQNFKNWELIIVDDGSTDNTDEVVSKFLNDKRIKYIKLEKNSGVNVARNRAIKESKGEYFILLDSDNELNNDILNIFKKYIDTYNFPYMKFLCQNQDGKYTVDNPYFKGYVEFKDFLEEKLKGEYQTLIKSKLLKTHLFFEDINGGEGIIWKLIAKETQKVLFLPEVSLIYYDNNEDRLSNRGKNYQRLYKVFKKDLEVLGKDYTLLFFLKNYLKMSIYFILSKLK